MKDKAGSSGNNFLSGYSFSNLLIIGVVSVVAFSLPLSSSRRRVGSKIGFGGSIPSSLLNLPGTSPIKTS